MSSHYFKPLLPDNFYHILNRGNNKEKLFYKKDNYDYFLKKYDNYLSDYLTTYAYCLLGNHFHLLVKLNTTKQIIQTAEKLKDIPNRLSKFNELAKSELPKIAGLIISNQFRKFFMAYAKAINNQEKRTGSLFQKNFERFKIDNIRYLNNVIEYIHKNPVHHGFTNNFKDYPYSSYERIIIPKPSKLPKHEILENFNGKENYIRFHKEKHSFNIIRNYIVE
ncbi:MAG: transposase [Bacteroidetes bacterium]|nr:MAG: transposase [Bacteroidota bacterium]